MKNILPLPSWLLVVCLMTTALLVGCKPSAEQQARIAEQRREHTLNNIEEGDVLPKADFTTQAILKLGGKFFIAPKEYFTQGGMHGFYWPSKTPMYRGGGEYPEREMVRSGKAGAVAIEFQIEGNPSSSNTYELVENATREGSLLKRETIRTGLDRVEIKRASKVTPIDVMYIATEQRLPISKLPPTLACNETSSLNAGATRFMWKPGFRIYVRFSSDHCKDWPEIYSEIIRVLTLVKEA